MLWPLGSVCFLLLSLQMQLHRCITDVEFERAAHVYGARKFHPRHAQDIHALSGSVPAVHTMSGDISGHLPVFQNMAGGVSPILSMGKSLVGGVLDVGDGSNDKEVEEAGDVFGTLYGDNPGKEVPTLSANDEGVHTMAGGGIFTIGGTMIENLVKGVSLFAGGQESSQEEEDEDEEEEEYRRKSRKRQKGLLGGLLSRFI